MIMHLVALPRKRAMEIGSKTYVDPWACKRGHFTHKAVNKRVCYECSRASSRNHMRRKYEDPEYYEELKRKRRERYNSDEVYRRFILDRQAERYHESPEKVRERNREYARANREAKRERDRDYYQRNKVEIMAYQKWYVSENPEKANAWFSASRAKRRERFIPLSDDLGELNQLCMEEAYHAAKERSELFGFEWHVDHMIPLQADEASGLHIYSNIQVIPAHLNQLKHKKMIYTEDLEWLADAAA